MPTTKATSIGIGTLFGCTAVLLVGVPVAVLEYINHVDDLADVYGVPFLVARGIGFDALAINLFTIVLIGFVGALQGALTRALCEGRATVTGLAISSPGLLIVFASIYGFPSGLSRLGVMWLGYLVSVGAVVLVSRKTSRQEDDPDGDDAPTTAAN